MVMFITLICVVLCVATHLGGTAAKCRDEDSKFFSLCPEPEVSARVGERLTLSCARNGQIHGCYWYYRRGIYDTSISLFSERNKKIEAVEEVCMLHLSTEVESTGFYQCIPHVIGDSNPAPLVETKLTVYRSPELIGLPKYDNNIIHLKEGARNELKCRTRNGTPSPRFSWFIGYRDVTSYAEEDDNMSILKLHKVKDLREYHTNMVFCQVTHPTLDSPATFNASLDILFKPRLLTAASMYTASALEGQLSIPFEVTTNPELSIKDYMLIIENPHGLVEHKLKPGEKTFSKTYSLSLPERVKSTSNNRWKFTVFINSVTEEVLNNIHRIRLTNTEGMKSEPFSFRIRLKTDPTKLAGVLAASSVCVLAVFCIVVSVIKKRNDKKQEEAWKLWTSEEKLSRTRWDTLPYISDDLLDAHPEKKTSVDEHKDDEDDVSEDSETTSRGTHTIRSKSGVTAREATVGSEGSKRTAGSLNPPTDTNKKNDSSVIRSALQCVI